MHNYFRQTF